jgi:hypothetical protein
MFLLIRMAHHRVHQRHGAHREWRSSRDQGGRPNLSTQSRTLHRFRFDLIFMQTAVPPSPAFAVPSLVFAQIFASVVCTAGAHMLERAAKQALPANQSVQPTQRSLILAHFLPTNQSVQHTWRRLLTLYYIRCVQSLYYIGDTFFEFGKGLRPDAASRWASIAPTIESLVANGRCVLLHNARIAHAMGARLCPVHRASFCLTSLRECFVCLWVRD